MSGSTTQHTGWGAVAARALPIVTWLPRYDRSRLRGDVLAGAIVAALMIPQSLGYARIAGVPVEVGLYAVPLALLAYAALGSSPQLIVGPASTVAIVSGSLVADISRDNPEDAVAITSALAIAAGIVLIATGLLRVAWIAEFLSKPIVTGFVFGLTLTIVIGELPTLLGIAKPPGDLIGVVVRTIENIGDTHAPTAIMGASALIVLFGGRRLSTRVPWGLVTLIGAVAASSLLDLESEGVAVVGDVPGGLPPIGLPLIPQNDLGAVVVGGATLALVALAEGLAATRLFATRGGYRVETERELVGMGAANVGAGLSGGFGVAGSLSKTASADQSGSTSQVTGLAAAGLVVVVLLAFTWVFTELPLAVLSAIVIAAVWGLMDVKSLVRYREVRGADFVAAMVGIGGVVLFGPLPGLGIAIATSLLAIIYRSSAPRMEVLGKISGEKAAWGRLQGHSTRTTVAGVVVVRLDAPLFWANATAFEDRLLAELDRWPGTRALVLDLEATSQLDTTSADMLEHLHGELATQEVRLYLARVIHPVSQVLAQSGFLDVLGDEHIWHSISQCVRAARRATGLKRGADEVDADAAGDGDGDARSPDEDRTVETEMVDDETDVVDADDADTPEIYAGRGKTGRKRDNAIGLYVGAMRYGRPRAAATDFLHPRCVQHGIDGEGTEGFVSSCERFIEDHPHRYVRVVRTIEDGSLVFLHAFESLDHGRTERVVTDFFDTDEHDRILEMWSVTDLFSLDAATRRTAVDGPTEVTDLERTEGNKAIVRELVERGLVEGRAKRIDRLIAATYVEHGDTGAEGRTLRDLVAGKHPSLVVDDVRLFVGQGNFVATLSSARHDGVPCARVDVFRVEHGKVAEHWDNSEAVPVGHQSTRP